MGKKTYLDYFPEIYEGFLENTKKRLNKVKNIGLPKNVGFYYTMLLEAFSTIGIGEIVLNFNVVQAKKDFYNSARLLEAVYKSYDNKLYDIETYNLSTKYYSRMFPAILSDCDEVIISIAQLFGGRVQEEAEDNPIDKNIGYAIKHILLNQEEMALSCIEKLKDLENINKLNWDTGYMITLRGIVNKDSDLVNEGLKYLLECHRKRKSDIRDTPEELICIPVLALAKIAIKNGIDIKLDDPMAPTDILQNHELQYPEIDFI